VVATTAPLVRRTSRYSAVRAATGADHLRLHLRIGFSAGRGLGRPAFLDGWIGNALPWSSIDRLATAIIMDARADVDVHSGTIVPAATKPLRSRWRRGQMTPSSSTFQEPWRLLRCSELPNRQLSLQRSRGWR
jgi:hypothetical protein